MKRQIKFKRTNLEIRVPDDTRLDPLIKGIKSFLRNELFLIEHDLNERTISAKLAEYLQKKYSKYNVDCEYNRMPKADGNEEDRFDIKRMNVTPEPISSDDSEGNTVFPDIIVHKRGINENNLLVIEIKKKRNNEDRDKDYTKLKNYTIKLKYTWGIFLEFNEQGVSELKFYKDGNEINCKED